MKHSLKKKKKNTHKQADMSNMSSCPIVYFLQVSGLKKFGQITRKCMIYSAHDTRHFMFKEDLKKKK